MGYPRSGTTFLQSLLLNFEEVESFPETHFFHYLIQGNYFQRKLKIVSSRSLKKIQFLLADKNNFSSWLISYNKATACFIKDLDEKTLRANKRIWVEKTPGHLHIIKLIERYVDNPLFIHIIRNPVNAITSLHKVTTNYPVSWGGARSVNNCMNRWIEDVRISLDMIKKKQNHHLIIYDKLVTQTKTEMDKIAAFLSINSLPGYDHTKYASKIVEPHEPWKNRNFLEVVPQTGYEVEHTLSVMDIKMIHNATRLLYQEVLDIESINYQ
ncbi:MAG: sulfotransferase [Fulvivirga sp.]|uniref:sulfotransferase family protein n=1 Tax=Fulvivirga sp. TaxID=1931237 RepID=UPI0032F07C94